MRGERAALGRCGWEKEKGERARLLGRGRKRKKEAGLGRCGNKRGKGWAVFWVGLDC